MDAPPKTRMNDGITRAERRILARAGIDVLLTNSAFKQPDIVDKAPISSGIMQRKVHFADDAIHRHDAQIPPLQELTQSVETMRRMGGNNLEPGFIRDELTQNDDDNTDSYDKVRKIIFDQAIQYNITKLEQKNVNFTDIVDVNDHHALENRVSEDIAARFGEGDAFRLFMLLVIVANSVMIGLQTNYTWDAQYGDVFYILDFSFLAIYIMEILFKWFYGFTQFWKSGWNWFDLLIVALSLIGSYIPIFSNAGILRLLRVLRAFRTLRSITILNGLQVVVQTILDSIPDMLNVTLLLLVIMFIWAVVGVTLFSSVLPDYFGDLGSTMFTLFVMATQIGWLHSFDYLEEKGQFTAAAIYYTSFMIVGVFIFLKIIVAVVVSNLEDSYANRSREQLKSKRALKSAKNLTQGKKKYRRSIRNMPPSFDAVWKSQIPYEIPDFDKISKTKVENYFLLLTIIEENLREFNTLRSKLRDIQFEVRMANSRPSGESEEDIVEDEDAAREKEDEGDALSRWIKTKGE
ncbi:Ion transport protein-domain-containing protein [Chytriomyces cf. hyalinus JEL632]|nr:Ion transport protein-domain-containing protein [Chytriomyces cf. hyalinus JEL632]